MTDVEELMREAMRERTPHLTLPPGAAARAMRTGRRRRAVERAGAGIAVVAVAGGLVAVAQLPRHGRGVPGGVAEVTLTATGPATPQQLTSAAGIVRARLAAEGITAHTAVAAGVVTVSVPASARAAVVAAARPGFLTFREIYTDAGGTTYASPVADPAPAGAATTVIGLDPPAGEPDQTVPSSATLAQFAALDCSTGDRPATVDEDPHHFVVACDQSGRTKYLLTPADLLGSQVASATATEGQNAIGGDEGQWVVDLTFRQSAVPRVEAVSTRLFHHDQQQLAITVDGTVVDAPATDAVLDQDIEIAGGQPTFSEQAAKQLAAELDAGSLPVALAAG